MRWKQNWLSFDGHNDLQTLRQNYALSLDFKQQKKNPISQSLQIKQSESEMVIWNYWAVPDEPMADEQ